MKTTLINQQNQIQIHLPKLRTLTAELAEFLAKADPQTRWGEISVLLTDDAGITPVNVEFFGKNQPTDVISFRGEPVPGENETSGDLIVNIECALREGPAHDGPSAELALYIAHGLNHLSGAEDDTPKKRAAMRRTETQWLAALKSDMKTLILK